MEELKLLDRRLFERIPVTVPLRYLELNSGREVLAYTRDISANGIGLVTEERLSPEAPLEMWLQIPHRSNSIYAKGKVVWAEEIEPNRYRAGVSLDKTELVAMSQILMSTRQELV
ncbi:MAG: PilZ domain-containing protein [Deltaproteobacteria bacterium]